MAMSEADKRLITNPIDIKRANEIDAAYATATPEQQQAFHAEKEAMRSRYGYTGGADGNGFQPLVDQATGYTVNPSLAGVSTVDKTPYYQLAQAQSDSQQAQARADYIKNITNMANSYNQNRADLYSTGTDTYNQYAQNIADAYKQAYINNAIAQTNANSRGLTGSALGTAMGTSALVNAANQADTLRSDRDTALSSIAAQLDRLAADYNIDRDAALNTLYNTERQATSDAYSNLFNNLAQADSYNSGQLNNYLNTRYATYADYLEAQRNRDWQGQQASNEMEWQYKITDLQGQQALEQLELSNKNSLAMLRLQAELGLSG